MPNSLKKLVELRDGEKARVPDQRSVSQRRISGNQGSAVETHRPGLYERREIVLNRMQDRPVLPRKG